MFWTMVSQFTFSGNVVSKKYDFRNPREVPQKFAEIYTNLVLSKENGCTPSSLCISWGLALIEVPDSFAWFSLTQIILFISLNHWWSPSLFRSLLKVVKERKIKKMRLLLTLVLPLTFKKIRILTMLPLLCLEDMLNLIGCQYIIIIKSDFSLW